MVIIIIQVKACPKCRGAIAFQQDRYGAFWACLNCGKEVYPHAD